jgi:hypothetical protein
MRASSSNERVTVPASGHAVLWRRLDRPGHEAARLTRSDARWHLDGIAVFAHEKRACRLDYRILCDSAWRSLSGEVSGWIGPERISVEVVSDSAGSWRLNGEPVPQVEGCIDLDLNFSPATNLLPIRRLNLQVGEAAEVRAAWLRFPSFRLELLEQTYRRTAESAYRYESAGGRFTAELRVDTAGFPLEYPGGWIAEAAG